MHLQNSFRPVLWLAAAVVGSGSLCPAQDYPIVDTGQKRCYDNRREITCPKPGEPFFGQDAQYRGNQPAYRDNGDGTVTDLVTGLMWQKNPGPKRTFEEAVAGASVCRAGGYADWRLPSIKELYSLILFNGEAAAYVAFGRSQGWMPGLRGSYQLLDVHGAGSQRSDPKAGDPSQFPRGRGPQGDVIAIYNMVRPVRGGLVPGGADDLGRVRDNRPASPVDGNLAGGRRAG